MKEALLKKRYGIPAALLFALLLVLVFSGTALAWYSFTTVTSIMTVDEPLSVSGTDFSVYMYPGTTYRWFVDLGNSADVGYTVKADLTSGAPNSVWITHFYVAGTEVATDLMNGESVTFDISAGTTPCRMDVYAAPDTSPRVVKVSLELSRG